MSILEPQGYICTRSASSKGLWDVVAVKALGLDEEDLTKKSQKLPMDSIPEVKLIQSKLTKKVKFYEDENCKKFRKLEVPKHVSKELWVFYENPSYPKGYYEVIKL